MTILYITEYDALHNGQTVTHVKRCMETKNGFIPVPDREDIFFANAAIKEDSDKSELLQLFLRKDAFEDARFPELSRAVKYFKETEGGRLEVCKTVENYAMNYAKSYAAEAVAEGRKEGRAEGRKEERLFLISNMIKNGYGREAINQMTRMNCSEDEYAKASQELMNV